MEQKKIWNKISEQWNKVRVKPFKEVLKFLENKKGKVLDLGCGSGRNFIKRKGLDFYGIDFSEKMLNFAEDKDYVELKESGVDFVLYDDGFFDFVIFVSVLHCVDSVEKRKRAIEEIYRVLKVGGEAFISVWSENHPKIKNKGKILYVPWNIGREKIERWTYIYDKSEIEGLIRNVGFDVVRSWEDKNINLIVRKLG